MEPYPPAYEDVPASQIYMGKDVRKYGMLKKKTGGKKIPFIQNKYDQRFVVINKGWVYYYKDKSSEKRQGNFSLQGFSNTVINAEEEEATMTFVFKIYSKKANERTWYFATETRLDMEQWMEAFRLEIEQYNVRGIPNIRSSKSCPVNPLHSPGGLSRLDINNGRPQSVHTAAPRHDPLPGSVFSSRTDITSGIGSSTQSIEGEDFYEPVDDFHGEAIDPSYNPSSPRQQFSPRDWKTLPPLPETPHNGRSATIGPEDLPPRPPPAPPSHFQHIASPATHTPMHNILGYSKNNANKPYEYGVQRPSSSSREMLRGSPSPTAISQKHFSPLPSYPTYPKPQVPALPPKPSTPKDLPRNPHIGMLPFKPYPPNEQYYDDTADPPKYDDSDVETSVYDIPEEDSLYEPGLIEEMIYEQDQSNNKPLPPTPPLKPGKKYNMAPLLPQKPTAKHPAHPKVHQQSGNCRKSGLATSNFSNPNEKMTTVVEHGTKPTWQSKLKSTTAPHEAAAGNKAPWLTKLKPTEDLKVAATTTSAVYKAESRPSWVKDPTNAAVQKPVNISKSPWHKEEQQSGIKIMESKVPTSGFGSKPSTGMRPPLSQKPELSKPKPPVIKPSPPHKPAIKDNKPPTAQKPKPSVAHSLNVAKLRDRFVQQ